MLIAANLTLPGLFCAVIPQSISPTLSSPIGMPSPFGTRGVAYVFGPAHAPGFKDPPVGSASAADCKSCAAPPAHIVQATFHAAITIDRPRPRVSLSSMLPAALKQRFD